MSFIPSEWIKNSMDVYLRQHPVSGRAIYLLVLFALVVALAALPFIYVDVSVQNAGIVRPVAEKTEIKSSITERVDSVYVKEGQTLNQGDTILTFIPANPDLQIEYRQKRLADLQEHLNDLALLSKGQQPDSFSSTTRRQEYILFLQRKREQETNVAKARTDFERHQKLFGKGIISEEEYENYRYEYDKNRNALSSLRNNQINQWQNDLNTYSNLFEEMTAAMNQEIKEKDHYTVICPISGTLDQFNGVYAGSMIQAGSVLAVVSPDSTLYAEAYVSPRNIGYIHKDMPVHIQIGSFNYSEWGTLSGKVTEISSDFMTDASGQNAFYKVKCSMDKYYLTRKNGVKGSLKKGMSISAHFIITRRSLFDLLYQKMDDWANPTQYTEK
ncbi:MAG: HlyD family secretion protein [Dysgonamonadaceae bacterium]|nr:HlyD family secretion protein [Dysgonamonadaceae bacterium]